MSQRRFHDPEHHAPFAFTRESEDLIGWWERKYPADRRQSAVIPALWIAQKQNGGWLSEPALRAVGDRVGMSYIRVFEVASFYTMFNLEPVGRFLIQVCGTTPCMLRGAEKLKGLCERKIGPKGQVSETGMFSWVEVECLGACVNAPMAQINDYFYEDLTVETLEKLIDDLASGKNPPPGTYVERQTSAPAGLPTSLTDETLFDGSRAQPLSAIPNAPTAAPPATPTGS
jgi:NADH-quinone oxidoreductase subunit E